MKIPLLYKKYHIDKDYTSIGLFRAIKDNYNINNVFYPGSHVHITPSLIFSKVTYADSYRNTYKFFKETDTIDFLINQKEYPGEANFRFYQQDYNKTFKELGKEFDMVISQYAGFVGQAAKPYLQKGGILVCNNSHGDASMASMDKDFKLVAVYRRYADDKFTISNKNLDEYLVPKNKNKPTKGELLKSMKGIAYTKSPSGYIFEKISE